MVLPATLRRQIQDRGDAPLNSYSAKKSGGVLRRLLPCMAIIITLAACGGEPTATSTPVPSVTGASTPVPDSLPTQPPTPTQGTRNPASTPTSTSTPAQTRIISGATPLPTSAGTPTDTPTPSAEPVPLTLELLAPQDGAGVETGAVRVLGRTRVDAAVGINGVPVEVAADGSFTQDLLLEEGINLVEVVASDLSGQTAAQQAAVFFISTAAGLPFTLFYPTDGLEASDNTIRVIGGTRPDAVVGVNGIPVEVNALGIFATTVALEDGANFIEVVATDIDGNVRFQTATVFYLP